MAGLCGWFAVNAASPGDALEAQGAALPGLAGPPECRCTNRLGSCLVRGGWTAQEGDVIAAITGHPQWRKPALAECARERDPAQALLEAWRQQGSGLFEQITGDFALVIVDAGQGHLVAGTDRLGQTPLHFARLNGGVAFGTSAGSVIAHPAVATEVTREGLYHYCFFHMLPAPVSLFAGLEKLPAAHCLIHNGDRAEVNAYWRPVFAEDGSAAPAALEQELRERVQIAVDRRADSPRTGAFLSGGLDSSTVAGMLAGIQPGADSFSIGFNAPGYDEMEYARIAAQHFGTQAHEYYVTPEDVVEAVPRIAASYDEPFGNSSALPAYFCARMAKDAGMTRLLAGDGGDELFAGNARYAKQGVFEHWGRIPAPLRRNLLDPLFTRLPRALPVVGKARSYVEQARIPLPDRLETYNYLHRLSQESMFTPDFLAGLDREAPWELMRRIYTQPEDASTLNRMMYLDWQQTLADNDLRKVTGMCQLAGVDVTFPMLDDDLVEFSCRVPSALKLKKGRLRHFYKEAFTGFLPEAIIDKKKHGFGLPFGVWMQEHAPLQELAYDSLLRLKGRDFLRDDFIDELIRLHREEHAAYYGELVWVLMMLDLWLESHPAAR
ncbi:asparagine synthetase B [Thioalkalivibrio sp. ALE17]|uniref:asparagine synthetase B family protein n=1 Tax=Thioalkalivibrio sp. ALE17 TaxID=1158173 RepID=UPI00057011D4|nr:asparagine synthase-related protein [Thioalkalivibrio sp. ALE17]